MPVAGIYTTKEVQGKLIHGIQDVIVKTSNKVSDAKSLFGIIWALKDLIGVSYRLWKLGEPTHLTVNTRNGHVLVDLRDWFLEHDTSVRRIFYKIFFNFVIIKYQFDGHMGRRLEKWLEKWYEFAQDGRWIFTHKNPETDWKLTEEEKNEPTYQRQQALQKALDNEEWDKVLNLID